jgi:hypothetical protein
MRQSSLFPAAVKKGAKKNQLMTELLGIGDDGCCGKARLSRLAKKLDERQKRARKPRYANAETLDV